MSDTGNIINNDKEDECVAKRTRSKTSKIFSKADSKKNEFGKESDVSDVNLVTDGSKENEDELISNSAKIKVLHTDLKNLIELNESIIPGFKFNQTLQKKCDTPGCVGNGNTRHNRRTHRSSNNCPFKAPLDKDISVNESFSAKRSEQIRTEKNTLRKNKKKEKSIKSSSNFESEHNLQSKFSCLLKTTLPNNLSNSKLGQINMNKTDYSNHQTISPTIENKSSSGINLTSTPREVNRKSLGLTTSMNLSYVNNNKDNEVNNVSGSNENSCIYNKNSIGMSIDSSHTTDASSNLNIASNQKNLNNSKIDLNGLLFSTSPQLNNKLDSGINNASSQSDNSSNSAKSTSDSNLNNNNSLEKPAIDSGISNSSSQFSELSVSNSIKSTSINNLEKYNSLVKSQIDNLLASLPSESQHNLKSTSLTTFFDPFQKNKDANLNAKETNQSENQKPANLEFDNKNPLSLATSDSTSGKGQQLHLVGKYKSKGSANGREVYKSRLGCYFYFNKSNKKSYVKEISVAFFDDQEKTVDLVDLSENDYSESKVHGHYISKGSANGREVFLDSKNRYYYLTSGNKPFLIKEKSQIDFIFSDDEF